jgi:hypothetical protein
MRIRRTGQTRSSSRSSYKTWCTRRSDDEVAFCFCGVVVLLFDRELGERVLPPRRWMWLRLCAVVLRSGPELLRSGAVVLCSGSDVCGSRADLRSGSCRCRSQLLRSGPGRSQLLRSGCS